MKAMVKMTLRMHIEAKSQKVPALVRRIWKRLHLKDVEKSKEEGRFYSFTVDTKNT